MNVLSLIKSILAISAINIFFFLSCDKDYHSVGADLLIKTSLKTNSFNAPVYAYQKKLNYFQTDGLPIGQLIMDQSIMAGIGNIYRTEILWRQAIHPEIPGKAISRHTFDRIWDDAAYLLAIGMKRNAIVTVETHLFSKKRSSEKYNIFGTVSCPKCNGDVRRLEINKRRAFVCDKCQPLPEHVS